MIRKKIFITVTLLTLGLVIFAQPASAGGGIDCATQSYIPAIECQALEAFFDSTNGWAWTDSTGWLTNTDPCTWYGLTCGAGHVTSISMFSNGLTGTLPLELGDLSSLRDLLLHYNQLTGSIPAELGSISTLEWVWLHVNQLSGPIPPEIGNLSNLDFLSLSNNQLSGTLPSQLGNLSALELFFIGGNPLVGVIPMSFTNLTSLTGFVFSNTGLCEPDKAAYQTWKAGVTSYEGTPACTQEIFYSQSTYDGWVLESAEDSGTGGTLNTSNLTCYVGDDAANKQYRTILHFNTSRLPDGALISQVTLQYKQHSIIGSDPYITHGRVWADINQGFFSGNAGLVLSDFAATASMQNAGFFKLIPSLLAYDLYRTTLKPDALQYLNLAGTTQFRLRFGVDDDNDSTADYIKLFCGDMPEPFNRPVLRVWYYVP